MHIYMSIEDWMLRSTEQSMVTLADSEYSSGRRVLLVLPDREQSLSEPPSSVIIDGIPRHGENLSCVEGASLHTQVMFCQIYEKAGDTNARVRLVDASEGRASMSSPVAFVRSEYDGASRAGEDNGY